MEKYEKKETLGQGQFGIVFKAVNKQVCRPWLILDDVRLNSYVPLICIIYYIACRAGMLWQSREYVWDSPKR